MNSKGTAASKVPDAANALPRPLPKPLAFAYLACSMALVGCYVALSKPLVAAIPVLLLAWLRFGIGSVAMLHWRKGPEAGPPMTGATQRLLFLESFFGNFLFSICMLYGVGQTSAVSAGIIMACIPAAIAVLSWIFLQERIPLRVGLAIACAVCGVALLAASKTGAPSNVQPSGIWGDLLLVAAVLCEATYAVIGKKLVGQLSPRRIAALINLWGFALMTPFGLWMAWSFDFQAVSSGIWLLLLFYALAASVVSVWLWMRGAQSVPASQAGIFTVMLPVSAVLTGVFVLGEPLLPAQLVALCLALAGIALASFPSVNRPKQPL